MRSNQNNKDKIKNIAKERIRILFEQANNKFNSEPQRAHTYVELARKLAMKAKLRMPRIYKRQYCTHCYKFIRTGTNATIRIHLSKIIISCKECKKFTRIPLTPKRKMSKMKEREKQKSNLPNRVM